MEYRAETLINVAPADAWAILTDAAGLASWDSGITRVDGVIARGATFKLWAAVSPRRAFTLKVATFEPPSRMTWTSGLPLGLFRGERTFTLTPAGGGTAFMMREVFSGPLLPLIRRSMPDLQPSFDQFARGLKASAEGQQGAT